MRILDNFITICGCNRQWNPQTFLKETIEEIRRACDAKKVFLLVSGGVDSSVAFALLNNALGPSRVLGLHIDTGLMRDNESNEIMRYMKKHGFDNLTIIDASQDFLRALSGVVDPEAKREVIGAMFIKVQEKAVAQLGLNADEWILGQGTIYPDTIESAGTAHSERIKTHHNRVETIMQLIEKGLVVEPLAQFYKDEVRRLGEAIGLPGMVVWRHPFPGPGLGVRVLCSDGAEEEIDAQTQGEVSAIAKAYRYKAVVLPIRSVGVQGDARSYARPALLIGNRDWDLLEEVSTRIVNSVRGVNRVVFGLQIDDKASYRLIKAYLTSGRLDLLRALDRCATELLIQHGQYDSIWQMPVVLLPLVNTSGDQCVVLRPITSEEAMTARFAPLKPEVLKGISEYARRTEGIGDVFIDITNKPPGTIEWE